jgi:hypothetical protein
VTRVYDEAGNVIETHENTGGFKDRVAALLCRERADGVGHGFFNDSPWYERTLYRADKFLASLGYIKGPPTISKP